MLSMSVVATRIPNRRRGSLSQEEHILMISYHHRAYAWNRWSKDEKTNAAD